MERQGSKASYAKRLIHKASYPSMFSTFMDSKKEGEGDFNLSKHQILNLEVHAIRLCNGFKENIQTNSLDYQIVASSSKHSVCVYFHWDC